MKKRFPQNLLQSVLLLGLGLVFSIPVLISKTLRIKHQKSSKRNTY